MGALPKPLVPTTHGRMMAEELEDNGTRPADDAVNLVVAISEAGLTAVCVCEDVIANDAKVLRDKVRMQFINLMAWEPHTRACSVNGG